MASANPPSQNRAMTKASVARPAPAREKASTTQVAAPSRREFLYYIWGASMALLLGQVGAGLLWFVFPRFREGEFGGVFNFNPGELPAANTIPTSVPSGRFHVTQTDEGVLALYGVCTHLGCLPRWVPTNNRFECPCHGSKFDLDGGYIEGPAPRALDRFVVTVTYTDGEVVTTPEDGGPIPIDANRTVASIQVDTGARINGPINT